MSPSSGRGLSGTHGSSPCSSRKIRSGLGTGYPGPKRRGGSCRALLAPRPAEPCHHRSCPVPWNLPPHLPAGTPTPPAPRQAPLHRGPQPSPLPLDSSPLEASKESTETSAGPAAPQDMEPGSGCCWATVSPPRHTLAGSQVVPRAFLGGELAPAPPSPGPLGSTHHAQTAKPQAAIGLGCLLRREGSAHPRTPESRSFPA